jgi:hypothetical protein
MTIDSVLRAIGALTCVYTIGLFVAMMSTAALNAAASDGSMLCTDRSCHRAALAERHHAAPGQPTYHTAAMFIAGM